MWALAKQQSRKLTPTVSTTGAHIDADYGGETILCRIAKRWLSENWRVTGDDYLYLTAAQEAWDTITDALGPRVKAGAFENDRSVLLK